MSGFVIRIYFLKQNNTSTFDSIQIADYEKSSIPCDVGFGYGSNVCAS